jgi:hypothetical protein
VGDEGVALDTAGAVVGFVVDLMEREGGGEEGRVVGGVIVFESSYKHTL